MKVLDFHSTTEARDLGELEAILSRRHGEGVNAFWLSHGTEEYPSLSILVKNDLAVLHYLPIEHDAGHRSVGNLPGLKPGETTTFAMSENRADDVDELNEAVVPFSAVIEAAKEFFRSQQLPQSVQWVRL